MAPTMPYMLVECEQVPPSYFPIGIIAAAGYPEWSAATAEQQAESGWLTLRNGRVVDEESDSNISYIGPAV